MPSNAFQGFTGLLAYVDQLVEIHGKIQQGRGRRHQQEALHRSGVVLTVAAWESYVEKVIGEALNAIEPPTSAPFWSRSTFTVHRNLVNTNLGKFHTPNEQNVRRSMKEAFGFDPRASWEWRVGPRQWDAAEMANCLDDWLSIRHTIAHGTALPTDIPWIQNSSGTPRITLALLRECRRFFARLINQTDEALANHIATDFGIQAPW